MLFRGALRGDQQLTPSRGWAVLDSSRLDYAAPWIRKSAAGLPGLRIGSRAPPVACGAARFRRPSVSSTARPCSRPVCSIRSSTPLRPGSKPELDRCVRHYLSQGAAAGFSPNRLFDGAAYLALNPDVAAAQMNPFLHFVAFGIGEGRRNRVPDSYLAQVGSMTPEALRERRVSEQALAIGWRRDLPSVWTNSAVAVYASSLGNFFFRHIADRIAEGLRAAGVRVYRLDQNSARPPDTEADFFVAPHEFFHLGSGPRWRDLPAVAGKRHAEHRTAGDVLVLPCSQVRGRRRRPWSIYRRSQHSSCATSAGPGAAISLWVSCRRG